MTELIIQSMARTLFVSAYMDASENGELGPDMPRAGQGEDWMDVAPATPDYYTGQAWRLCGKIEQLNGMALICIFSKACIEDGGSFDQIVTAWREGELADCQRKYITDFGFFITMQSLGDGVSWFDDHNRFQLKLPLIETELVLQ